MDYQWLDEDEALRLCRSGDTAAYAVIVRRYQSEALRFAYLITGERGAAEDAAQDAFFNAYLNIRRYDPQRPFRPWLYKILSNAALKKRRKPQPQPLDENILSRRPPRAGRVGRAERHTATRPSPTAASATHRPGAEVLLRLQRK